MIEILLLIALTIVLFLSFLWPVRKVAVRLKAQRLGYGPVAIAVAVVLLVSLLTVIVLQPYLAAWWLLLINFVLAVGIFASVLSSTPLGALGIAAASYLLAAVEFLLVILLIGAFDIGGLRLPPSLDFFHDPIETQQTIEQAANRVCECRHDNTCLRGRFAQLSILIAQQGDNDPLGAAAHHQERARACVNRYRSRPEDQNQTPEEDTETTQQQADDNAPSANDTAATDQGGSDTDTGQTNDTYLPVVTTPLHQDRWTYRVIPIAEANTLIDEFVRITRSDNGHVIAGRLSKVGRRGTLSILQNHFGGTVTMQVPRSQVSKLEHRFLTKQ